MLVFLEKNCFKMHFIRTVKVKSVFLVKQRIFCRGRPEVLPFRHWETPQHFFFPLQSIHFVEKTFMKSRKHCSGISQESHVSR